MNPAARVVPDVASFAVDDGFWYSIPDHLSDDVHIGSIVRVPLSGRRVRGWVVERSDGREGKLKDIAAVSGAAPVFDERMLGSLLWAAHHYVAPVPVLLARASPPNLPRKIPDGLKVADLDRSGGVLFDVASRSARQKRTPVLAVVGNWRRLEWLADLMPVLAAGRSALVVAASAAEVDEIGAAGTVLFGDLAVSVAGEDDKTDTKAWEKAQSAPRLIVGTPKTASWQIGKLAIAVVLEEGRRAMKDRQTPTIHVRDLMRTRSRLEGFNMVFYGPTPSVELLAAGAEIVHDSNRAWPLVEVVDRADDLPGSGFLSERALAAISATVRAGERVFVFTHRRVGFASMRCTRCRNLRSCARCGTRVGRVETCPRCGASIGPCRNCGNGEFEEMGTIPERLVAEIDRRAGKGTAMVHPGTGPVLVGTERDLAGLPMVTLAVAADVDGMLLGTGYRTSEEALRQLARLALAVREGTGARMMLQTSRPDSLLVTTLRRGDPIPYLERVLVERAREFAPPSTEMIVVEIRGQIPDTAPSDLASLENATVMGPVEVPDGKRWLITGSLGRVRLGLRPLVGRWRDGGATVRVDADPIDV